MTVRPTLLALVFAIAACSRGDRQAATTTRTTSSTAAIRVPDNLVLRIVRTGGSARVFSYPGLDSVVWSGRGAPAPQRAHVRVRGAAGDEEVVRHVRHAGEAEEHDVVRLVLEQDRRRPLRELGGFGFGARRCGHWGSSGWLGDNQFFGLSVRRLTAGLGQQ